MTWKRWCCAISLFWLTTAQTHADIDALSVVWH